jgi:hypothetical protein
MLRGLHLPGARKVPVELDGAFARARQWVGNARAEEDIVGMVFLATESHCEWAKGAQEGACLAVHVALLPYDNAHRDVQVSVQVGGDGLRGRSLCGTANDTFRLERTQATTGTVFTLTQLPGEPRMEALALLLARSDVQFGRNRLWHLREDLALQLQAPLRSLFTRGRTGAIQA